MQYGKLDQPDAKEDEAMSDLPTKILVATDESADSVEAARRAQDNLWVPAHTLVECSS